MFLFFIFHFKGDDKTSCRGGKVFSSCVPSCQKTCSSKFAEEACLLEDKRCKSGKLISGSWRIFFFFMLLVKTVLVNFES